MKTLTISFTKKEYSRIKKQLLAIGLLPNGDEQSVIRWFASKCLAAGLSKN